MGKAISILCIAMITLGGCAVDMTEAGSRVRVVNSINADFVNECTFIKAMTVRKMQGNGDSLDIMNAKTEIRNSAPEYGANVVVYTDSRGGTLMGNYASADLYHCN
ncbi:MAG: hypothetical protein DRI24_17995 [Deltaproteobacteria bacterium]|nr:MAG: hypothetical protein DRI24_17995 [Deltaproteobacteria bacterium]